MKKFLVLGLIAMLGAGLAVGCSSDDSPNNNNNNNNNGNENPNGNDNGNNQTVSIVGKWVGDNGWEFGFYLPAWEGAIQEFSTIKRPPEATSLGGNRWEINNDNTEIKLYSINFLMYTLDCVLTATTLNITNAKWEGSDGDVSSNRNFPIGIYTKR